MADNKRPKEDFTAALKKQVGKVVPMKPARAQEKLRYTTDQGVEIEIVRGDESDAQWNAIKRKVAADQQAAAEKGAKETQQNERDRAWQALNNPKSQFVPELGIDEKTRSALLQMDPDKAIDFVLARSRNAERQRDPAKKSEEPKAVAREKPVEPSAPKRGGSTNTQMEDTLTVGSRESGGGSTPMARFANMAQQAMTGATGPEDAAAGINKTVNEAVDAAQLPSTPDAGVSGKFDAGPVEMTDAGVLPTEGSAPALNQAAQAQSNTRFYGQGGVVDPTMADIPLSTRGKLLEAAEPVTNFAQGLGNAAAAGVNAINAVPGKFGRAVANTLLPDGTPAPADADPMDAPASFTMPGQAPAQGGQVVAPGAPAPAPGATSGGVSVSGSTKTVKPGQGGTPAPVNPNLDAIRQATDTALAAGAASADIESKALQDKADLAAKQERDLLDAEKRAAEIQTIKAERMRKAEVGLASLQSRLAELEQQSIDPNRFWNNKSDGQKAMAVVAGALFGFTGQGMQWLQRLDSLVEQDIQTQFADFKRKEATLGKQVDIQNNIIALARQQGLDDTEALNAARASMKERYALQLENIAATSGSQLVQQKALQNAAAIRMGAAKDIEEMRLKTQTAAADMAVKYAQAAKLRQETVESRFNMGLSASGKGAKAEKWTPGMIERASAAQAAWAAIPDLEKAIGSGKVGDALVDEIAKRIPGTDAASRDQQAQLLGRIIFAGIDKSVVNAADQEFLNKLQSGVGLRSLSRGDLPAFRRLVQASFNSANKMAEQLGMQVLEPLPAAGGAGVQFFPSRS